MDWDLIGPSVMGYGLQLHYHITNIKNTMTKEEFFNLIKEAERNYYKNSPCYHCHSGNGCDDCRGCKDGYVDQEMRININKMKDEFENKYSLQGTTSTYYPPRP